MKDLYDFSLDRETHLRFYEQMQGVYKRVYHRFGLGDQTYMTASSGGSFSKYSFEFQTICQAGEDVIYYDEEKRFAVNQADYSPELLADFGLREKDCNFKEAKSIEVGDIYTLGEKYAQAIGLTYKDQQGRVRPVFMGSYGIGVPRVIGAVVELLADDQGLSWPVTIAPYELHLIQLGQNEAVKKTAVELYGALSEAGVEVLYDDRQTAAGEKFAEADLIGIPYQLIVSEKNVIAGELEVKDRRTGRVTNIDEGQIVDGVLKLLTRLKADLNPDQE